MVKEPQVKEYDIEKMTLFQIECKIEEVKNILGYYLDKTEYLEKVKQPKTSGAKEILYAGGIASSAFDNYLIRKENLYEKGIFDKINALKAEIKALTNYLNKQKEIIKKYDKIDQEIIYLRDRKVSWTYISVKTNYSIRQCQRIYNDYLNSRKKD